MKARAQYDAIIVGARAAGAATAMLMARRGMRVLALDRAPYGSDTLSTHALMRTAVAQLRRWNLLDRVRSSGAPPVRQVIFRYPDEVVTVPLGEANGVDALFAPRRTVLDAIVVDAAREAGAEVRFGVVVEGVRTNASGRVIGVTARDESKREMQLDAALVVGADGIRSVIAQSVSAGTIREARNSSGVVYGYFRGVEAAGYEWMYGPGLSAGLIPTNGGEVCAFVGGSETEFRRRVFPDLDRGFMDVLRQISPEIADRIAAGTRVERYRGFAGVRGYIRRCAGPGWALVGDAGYFRDPITTHGISDAFRDAELLSRAAASGASLEMYQALRDSVIGDLFEVSDAIAGYDWTMEEIRLRLREVSRAMKGSLQLLESMTEVVAA